MRLYPSTIALLACPAILAAQQVGKPEMADLPDGVFAASKDETVLKTERACIYSHQTLAERLTIHAIDSTGEVALAMDTIDPFRGDGMRREYRTIRSKGANGELGLYGRMQFMIAPTKDGGTRYTAVLPRDFLKFFADPKTAQLIVEPADGKAIAIGTSPTRLEVITALQACTETLED